jgi:DNA-binding CsgD family transcriptional regulator
MAGASGFPKNLIVLIVVAPHEALHMLSAQDTKLVRLLALGCNVQQAARILGVSRRTVQRHRKRLSEELKLTHGSQFAPWARARGLIRPGDKLSRAERVRGAVGKLGRGRR